MKRLVLLTACLSILLVSCGDTDVVQSGVQEGDLCSPPGITACNNAKSAVLRCDATGVWTTAKECQVYLGHYCIEENGNAVCEGDQGDSGNSGWPGDTGNSANSGDTANSADTADSANSGNTANSANTADSANSGNTANSADTADSVDSGNTANSADSADSVDSGNTANSADTADSVDSGNTANSGNTGTDTGNTAPDSGDTGTVTKCKTNKDCGSTDKFCNKDYNCSGVFGMCEDKPTLCPTRIQPVCGCDGSFYNDICNAHRVGVSADRKATGPDDCPK